MLVFRGVTTSTRFMLVRILFPLDKGKPTKLSMSFCCSTSACILQGPPAKQWRDCWIAWVPELKGKTRWWFQICFIFALTWGSDPIWRAYFSKGLKPPTRKLHHENLMALVTQCHPPPWNKALIRLTWGTVGVNNLSIRPYYFFFFGVGGWHFEGVGPSYFHESFGVDVV